MSQATLSQSPRRFTARRLAAAACVALAAATIGWIHLAATRRSSPPESASDLTVPSLATSGKLALSADPVHDFGATDQDQPGAHAFVIRNDGPGPLFIDLADKSCGCTGVAINGRPLTPRRLPAMDPPALELAPAALVAQVSSAEPAVALVHELEEPASAADLVNLDDARDPTFAIAPGDTASIELTWNTGQTSGMFEQWVRLATSDLEQPSVEFRIRGQVVPSLWAPETPVHIGAVRAGQSATARFQLFAKDSANLQIKSIHSSSPLLHVQLRPAARDAIDRAGARSGIDATIQMDAGLPIGTIQEQLVLATNLPDRPELIVPVTAHVQGEISFAPTDQFDFEFIAGDEPRTKNLIAQIRTEIPVRISVARVVPEHLQCTVDVRPTVQQSRQIAVIKLTVPSDAPTGPVDGLIELETDHPEAPRMRLPVRGVKLPSLPPHVAAAH